MGLHIATQSVSVWHIVATHTAQSSQPPSLEQGRGVAPSSLHRMVCVLALTVMTLGSLGCAPTPQTTLRRYAKAVAERDLEAGEQTFDPALRTAPQRATRSAFIEGLAPPERDAYAHALRAIARAPARVDATLPLSRFDTLSLVLTPEGWRIRDGLFNFYAQRTPREAVASLILALERKRFAVVLRLLPTHLARRTAPVDIERMFTRRPSQTRGLIFQLRKHLDDPIIETGDQAELRYGVGQTLRLIREPDGWKIDRLE